MPKKIIDITRGKIASEPVSPLVAKQTSTISLDSLGGQSFIIKSKLVDEGVYFPFKEKRDWTLHNKFKITVTTFLGGQKRQISFDYYGSHAEYEEGKTELTDYDRLIAFRSFLEDAYAGGLWFDDFVEEYGYGIPYEDKDEEKRVKQIYKACEKARKKAEKLGFLFDDHYEKALNELTDKEVI